MDLDISSRASADVTRIFRTFDLTRAEFRTSEDGKLLFDGVASVVDAPYKVRDRFGEFTETIKRGGFNKTLRDGSADVALYSNHDYTALPLATRLDGSLGLTANPHLAVLAGLNPARPSVQEAYHAVNDGQARQMSIGFSVPKARDKWNDDYTVREISEVNLHEVSIVWKGANHLTSAGFRSLTELMDLFPEGVEHDPDELQRAIAHFTSLLPKEEAVPDLAAHHAMRLALWAQKANPAT